MRKSKKKNLAEAVNDEELRAESELAFEEEMREREESEGEEKPILTETEIKTRRARRTKFAVAAFVLLLGVGVMGNWYYENSDFSANIKPSVSSSDTKTLGEAEYVDAQVQGEDKETQYFSEARVERQKARDEASEKLQGIIDKADESSEAKKIAAEKLADLSADISAENKIETLVSAKGVDNCLAVMNNEGNRVDVIVDAEELSDTLILQVKEIAMRETGCTFEEVSVIQSK